MGSSSTPMRGPKRAATSSAKRSGKKPRARPNIYDDPERLLSEEKSPIYKDNVNLKAILQHPLAQIALQEAGQDIPFSSMNCDDLASAVAAFKEDGRCGRHDPEWVRQAMVASRRRANGEFDEYVKAKFKETWGVDWTEGEGKSKDDGEDEDELASAGMQVSTMRDSKGQKGSRPDVMGSWLHDRVPADDVVACEKGRQLGIDDEDDTDELA